MSTFFFIQSFVVILLYSILILAFYFGWKRTALFKPSEQQATTCVSILIPCRNEEENIPDLFLLLIKQDYPPEFMEIIWIDDHSNDRTNSLISNFIKDQSNHHLVTVSSKTFGKKAALKAGMELAKGELVLLTDADSRPGENWVKTLTKFFIASGADLILGPVVIGPTRKPFDQIQKLEFMSLVAASVGAAGLGKPIMAQGPNIAVRSSDYINIVKNLDSRFDSGDDLFLLQAMARIPGKKIRYAMHPEAIVISKPSPSLGSFFKQRQRWASKAKGYTNPFLIQTTLLVFITNIEILAAFALAIAGLIPFKAGFFLLIIKTLVDIPLLLTATRFFRSAALLAWFLPVQILYPTYIVVAGILSQFKKVSWKS